MSSYVVTGGTDVFVAELSKHLRAPVHREPVESITSWIHIVGGDAGDEPVASLTAAAASADRHLPRDQGASLIAVVPVWGMLAPPHDGPAELAAATARALAKVSIERWSREGRRINIVAYGPLETDALPGLRDPATLRDRSPMHKPATLSDLADAIDFLSSSAASYVTGSELPVDGGWTAYSWFYPARDL